MGMCTARISLVKKFNKLRIKTPVDFRKILKRKNETQRN